MKVKGIITRGGQEYELTDVCMTRQRAGWAKSLLKPRKARVERKASDRDIIFCVYAEREPVTA